MLFGKRKRKKTDFVLGGQCWEGGFNFKFSSVNEAKVGLSSSKKNCFLRFNESPLKTAKNAFLFRLKSFLRSQDN